MWINGVDLSAHCAEASLNYSSETLDETAFGDTTRINKGGLLNWSIDFRFHQDFAAAAVDATLFNLVGTTTCFELRPNNSCSTAINPSFTGIGIVSQYPPMSGAVGTLLDATVTLASAGALSRASSS